MNKLLIFFGKNYNRYFLISSIGDINDVAFKILSERVINDIYKEKDLTKYVREIVESENKGLAYSFIESKKVYEYEGFDVVDF